MRLGYSYAQGLRITNYCVSKGKYMRVLDLKFSGTQAFEVAGVTIICRVIRLNLNYSNLFPSNKLLKSNSNRDSSAQFKSPPARDGRMD